MISLATKLVYTSAVKWKLFFLNTDLKATVAGHYLQQKFLQSGPDHEVPIYIDKKFKTACVPLWDLY